MLTNKLHVDLRWLNRISVNLLLFKRVRDDVFNCRCCVCGDSKKDKRATRMYFYVKGGLLLVKCHNCGYPNDNSATFFMFMKDQFPLQFEDYKKEVMLDSFRRDTTVTEKKVETNKNDNNKLPAKNKLLSLDDISKKYLSLDKLDSNHKAKKYMLSRKFGDRELSKLYYVPDFKELASKINPESSERLPEHEDRILIPFVKPDKTVDMVQGRALKSGSLKYITIKANDDVEKVYGLYGIDKSKPVYCVEGPLDSLFVDNCIATCDSNLTRVKADIYIWDNEPRNKEIVTLIESAINKGFSVVIWPTSPNSKQDINDLIKTGVSQNQLMKTIRESTYSGMSAKLKFTKWRKV